MGLREWIRQAGQPTESDTARNGFLSYSAEVHALGIGLGVGWLVTVTGDTQLLAVILPAITSGLRAKNKEFSKILQDIAQEPHYCIGAIPVGGLLGWVVSGVGALPF
jgi:hypothetical protein